MSKTVNTIFSLYKVLTHDAGMVYGVKAMSRLVLDYMDIK
jgi:hypothetical protein